MDVNDSCPSIMVKVHQSVLYFLLLRTNPGAFWRVIPGISVAVAIKVS